VLAGGVVGFPGQPGPDAQCQRRAGVKQRQDVPQALFQLGGADHGPVLAHPQAREAKRGLRHRLDLARQLSELVGELETVPAGPQVTIEVQGALAGGEHRPQLG
jgi:hypothetical protein